MNETDFRIPNSRPRAEPTRSAPCLIFGSPVAELSSFPVSRGGGRKLMNAAMSLISLFGATLLAFVTTHFATFLATAEEPPAADTKQAEEFVRKQFPVLRNPGMPPVGPI